MTDECACATASGSDESGRADWSLPVALACLLGVVVVVVGGLR